MLCTASSRCRCCCWRGCRRLSRRWEVRRGKQCSSGPVGWKCSPVWRFGGCSPGASRACYAVLVVVAPVLWCPLELRVFFLSDGWRGAPSQRLRSSLLSPRAHPDRPAGTPASPPGRSQLFHPPLKIAYLPGGRRRPPSLVT